MANRTEGKNRHFVLTDVTYTEAYRHAGGHGNEEIESSRNEIGPSTRRFQEGNWTSCAQAQKTANAQQGEKQLTLGFRETSTSLMHA